MPKNLDVTDTAVNLVCFFEGFQSRPYLDTIAKPPVWTYGYGSIRDLTDSPVTETTPCISIDLARGLVKRELSQARDTLVRVGIYNALSSDEAAALEDFIYNLGSGNFLQSNVLKLLRQGKYDDAANAMLEWDHAGGKIVAGLLKRRVYEENLFLTPDDVK